MILNRKLIGLLLISIISFHACSESDDILERDQLFADIPTDNQLIFDVFAQLHPEGMLTQSDTLWISIQMTNPLFTDNISNRAIYIPLDDAQFLIQIQVTDLISNKPPLYDLIVKKGSLRNKKDDLISLSFGYPDKDSHLLIGLKFKEIGKYTVNFINYPNPEIDEQLNAQCDEQCDNNWHDLFFYYDDNLKAFNYKAFIDYHFITNDKYLASNAEDYSQNSIYNDAVYTFTVK